MNKKTSLNLMLFLPFLSVFFQVGVGSSFPQINSIYNNAFYAQTFIAITPLVAMISGSFWGPVMKKIGEKKTLTVILLGWLTSLLFIIFFYKNPLLGITFRGVLGVFDSMLYGIALTGVSKYPLDNITRTKYYGFVEISGSLGAILGPLIIGIGFIYNQKLTFMFLFAVVLVYFIIALSKVQDIKTNDQEIIKQEKNFSPKIFLAALFGITVLTSIVSAQIMIPGIIEKNFNSPILGKIIVAIFSVISMTGNSFKHKIKGIRIYLPILASLGFLGAFTVSENAVLFVIFIMMSALFLGFSLTMSSEYASMISKGFEETGMTVFSSLRLSGNFFGPYIGSGMPFNISALLLGVFLILSGGFLKVSKEN